jgi:hypothetical protein
MSWCPRAGWSGYQAEKARFLSAVAQGGQDAGRHGQLNAVIYGGDRCVRLTTPAAWGCQLERQLRLCHPLRPLWICALCKAA